MIEVRKLQKVGASTLTVSLPKKWAIKKGLKPGDRITLVENDDGSLRLDVGEPKVTEEIVLTINYDFCKSNNMLKRLIVGAYIQGAGVLKIISSNALTTDIINEVQATVDKLPGFEIVEQTYRTILIQSFLDPSKFPIEVLLKRLQIMVAHMLNQLILSISEGAPVNLGEITRQESKVDELYFLTIRQLFLALRKWYLGVTLGIDSPVYAAGVRLVAKTLEDIGDVVESMAKGLSSIQKLLSNVNSDIVKKIGELGMTVQTLFSKAMKAFFSLDIELLNDVFDNISYVLEQQDKLIEDVLMIVVNNERLVSYLKTIVWGFGCIARNCEVIAEVAFNRLTRTPSNIISIEKA